MPTRVGFARRLSLDSSGSVFPVRGGGGACDYMGCEGLPRRTFWATRTLCVLALCFRVLVCASAETTAATNTVEVRSGRDLAIAFSSSPLVDTAVVMSDVWLRETDWEGLSNSSGNSSEPVLLTRDFKIIGSPSLPSWPLLNLGFVKEKIRLGNGVTLMARHVVIGDFRSGLITQAPGFDLAAPTLMPANDSTPALLVHNETAVLYSVCFPKAVWQQSVSTAVRPASVPGAQLAQMGVAQTGCVPPNATDAEARPGGYGGPGAEGAALLGRCWADRGVFTNMAFVGADVDKLGKLTPNNYAVWLRNVTYLCANVMALDCIQRLSPLGCALSVLKNFSASGLMPWQQVPEPPQPPQPPPQAQPPKGASSALSPLAAAAAHGGDSRGQRDRVTLGAALGGALGGALLIGLAVAAFLIWWRRGGGCTAEVPAVSENPSMNGKPAAECRVAVGDCGSSKEEGGAAGASAKACLMLRLPGMARPSSRSRQATTTGSFATSMPPTSAGSRSHASSRGETACNSGGAQGGGLEGDRPGCRDLASEADGPSSARALSCAAGTGTGTDVPRPAKPGPPAAAPLQPPLPPLDEDEHVVVSPLTPPRAELELGRAAAEEVRLLPTVRGRGTYGKVFEGLYRGDRVAVKLVREVGAGADAESSWPDHARRTFSQEVEVLGRCQHPNVVRLLAACLQPPRIFLVMELMETSLEKMVYDRPPGDLMPLSTVLHIALDVARGLEYLHPTILHRDLKPANILVNNPTGERPVAKITDFGVSRLRSSVLVTEHPEAGTPAFMAPETFDVNNYSFTHHMDIFSFGVCVWVMLTGEHPWAGCSVFDVAYKVTINRDRLPLHKLPPGRCPPQLAALLTQCWEHEPRRRPAAAELVKALRMLLDGQAQGPQAQ